MFAPIYTCRLKRSGVGGNTGGVMELQVEFEHVTIVMDSCMILKVLDVLSDVFWDMHATFP